MITFSVEIQFSCLNFYSKNFVCSLLASRVAPAQVVGWPPVRSFRKNLVYGSSAKLISNSPSNDSEEVMKIKSESSKTGLFVKINMDGVPIGRKIDLNAFKSYESLSYAIDELFRGLLAGCLLNFQLNKLNYEIKYMYDMFAS